LFVNPFINFLRGKRKYFSSTFTACKNFLSFFLTKTAYWGFFILGRLFRGDLNQEIMKNPERKRTHNEEKIKLRG